MRPPPDSNPFRSNDDATPDGATYSHPNYSAISAGVPEGIPTTVLHIGAQQTEVATGHSHHLQSTLTLAIGSRKTAGDYFKHVPPTPKELEDAIAAVEDEVARARTVIPINSALFTTDATVREIALIAGVREEGAELTLSLDATERTFERVVALTLGRPASREGVPTGTEFAATLLILREFMHHLKFSSITVKA